MSTCHLQRTVTTRLPTAEGSFYLLHYANAPDQKEHLALVMGDLRQQQHVLVRVHSECFTGDVLGSRRCDCGEQLHTAMQMIAAEGQGVVIYLRQEGRGIGLQKKLEAYNLQDEGHDTVDANLILGHQADERTYDVAVAILHDLGIQSMRLLTNNPNKLEQLRQAGLTVTARVPIEATIHAENRAYLATKVHRMRHLLSLPALTTTANGTKPTHKGNGVHSNGHHSVSAPAAQHVVTELQEAASAYFANHHLPFVTLSYAQSIDGSIADRLMPPGSTPLRISGDQSLTLTHQLRAGHDAILVGVGTVLADDPRLTVRLVPGADPQPVILDTHLRTPPTARILHNERRPWLVTATPLSSAATPLRAAGAELLCGSVNERGQLALRPLLQQLADRGIRSIMVEGGATVLRSFLQEGLAQAAVITIAPIFIGGLSALAGHGASSRHQAFPRLVAPRVFQLGEDTICYGHFAPVSATNQPIDPMLVHS